MPRMLGEGYWGGGNLAGVIPVDAESEPQLTGYFELIANQTHPILKERQDQIAINLLGLAGGRPYVLKRLSRFPGELKVEWEGGQRKDGSKVTGRRDRAHNVPHLGRIANKICEWIFSVPVKRTNADDEVLKNISGTGDSVTQLMKEVNNCLTVARWCWIGLNAPPSATDEVPLPEAKNYRPYWEVYKPTDVIDWKFDGMGELIWLKTEGISFDDTDPKAARKKVKMRFLWERGSEGQPATVTRFIYKDDTTIEKGEKVPLQNLTKVPFILVGKPTAEPHAFDDLESINKTILDLESCNDENYYKAMFPLRYIPRSALENAMDVYGATADDAASMMFGLGSPILLSPDDPTPGIMMPPGDAMGKIREEINSRKRDLFDAVGMMIAKETKQVESAEAKQWDHIDVEMFLRDRAQILQEAETQAVNLTKEWDPNFQEWAPEYNTEFDIPDFKEEIEALVLAEQMPQPIELTRLRQQRLYALLKKRMSGAVDQELDQAIMEAIEAFEGVTMEPFAPEPLQI